jgi:hypothetical protein
MWAKYPSAKMTKRSKIQIQIHKQTLKCVHIFCVDTDTYIHKGETIATTYSTREKTLLMNVHTLVTHTIKMHIK